MDSSRAFYINVLNLIHPNIQAPDVVNWLELALHKHKLKQILRTELTLKLHCVLQRAMKNAKQLFPATKDVGLLQHSHL